MDPLENLVRANPGIAITVGIVAVLALVAFAIVVIGGRSK